MTKSEHELVIQQLRESDEMARSLANDQGVLAEIGRIISSSLDIDTVYERFAQLVRPLVPFDNMGVGFIDSNTQTITLAYTTGESVSGRATGDAVEYADGNDVEIAQHILQSSFLMVASHLETMIICDSKNVFNAKKAKIQ